MFIKDFYPTPVHVIDQMLSSVTIGGKIFLEPSAGKGDIVDYLKRNGAKKVIACEINYDLQKIVAQKCYLIEADFTKLTPERVSHVDCIVMNPPFSADEKHILHAWEIAPKGCQIISLFNWETIDNTRYSQRAKLKELADQHGTYQELGDVFSTAERKTNVSIGLMQLFKPKGESDMEFEDYFDMAEEVETRGNGLVQYNEIRNIVDRYVGAVKMFNGVMEVSGQLNDLIRPISTGLDINFGAHVNHGRSAGGVAINRDTFKKELQKSAWKSVFQKMNLTKYVTSGVTADLNAFIEKQQNVPFTMKNIYLMAEMIVGTRLDRFNKVLIEAFDSICGWADSNNTAGKGWKTNSDYKVNRRFIHPGICDHDNRWPSRTLSLHYSASGKIDDLIKALCLLTGERYEDQIPLRTYFACPVHLRRDDNKKLLATSNDWFTDSNNNWNGPYRRQEELLKQGIKTTIEITGTEWGTWYDWGFFRVKGHKIGTMHFEFKDPKVWELFNRRVAEAKGWQLPKQTDRKTKGTERTVTMGVEVY